MYDAFVVLLVRKGIQYRIETAETIGLHGNSTLCTLCTDLRVQPSLCSLPPSISLSADINRGATNLRGPLSCAGGGVVTETFPRSNPLLSSSCVFPLLQEVNDPDVGNERGCQCRKH